MSFGDKIKNKSQETVGKVKEQAGEKTDNDELRAEGKGDQAEGNIKQAGEKVKDTFKK